MKRPPKPLHSRIPEQSAVLLWSSSAAAFSLLSPRNSAHAVVTLEFTLATAALIAIFGLGSLSRTSWYPHWHSILKILHRWPSSAWALVIVFCALNVTHELTYYLGIRSANPFEANALNYLWPLWLFLFSFRAGNRGARQNLAKTGLLMIAFAGTAIITLWPSKGMSVGYMPAVYGIASSVSAAGYMLVFARISRRYGATMPPLLLITLPICSLCLWLQNPADRMAMPMFFSSLPILIYLAVFTIVVPEILWSLALKNFGGSRLSLSAIQIPLYSTVCLALVTRIMPSTQVLCGGALILASLWLSATMQQREQAPGSKFSHTKDEDG